MSSGYFIQGRQLYVIGRRLRIKHGQLHKHIPIGALETSAGENIYSTSATLISIDDTLLTPSITYVAFL